jgi:hypothetical protein
MAGLGQEVRRLAGIEALLALGPQGEQALARLVEAAMQVGDEGESFRGEDLLEAGLQGTLDGNAGWQGESGGVRHGWSSDQVRAIIPRKHALQNQEKMTITYSPAAIISFPGKSLKIQSLIVFSSMMNAKSRNGSAFRFKMCR